MSCINKLPCEEVSAIDKTTCFWKRFIHKDMAIYAALCLAIRREDWRQRLCFVKYAAPLFHAFDRTTYQDLIVQHLGDIYNNPQKVVHGLESGGFVASICGNSMMSVADEMLINRETKACRVRTTPDALSKLAGYLPYRSNLLTNIKQQIIPKREKTARESTTFIPRSSTLRKQTTSKHSKRYCKSMLFFDSRELSDASGRHVIVPLCELEVAIKAYLSRAQEMQ